MKKIFLLLLLSLLSTVKSFCQTKMDDIKELINIIYKEKTSDESYDAVLKMMKPQMDLFKKLNKNNTAFMDSVMQDAFAFSKKYYKENMPLIYDRLFTQDEIKDYIRFYKTPSGQKLINSQNAIQKEMMDSVSNYIAVMQTKMKARLEERYANITTDKTDSAKTKDLKKDSFYVSYHALSDKLDSITRKELKNKIITDTAFMAFCFGDSPEKIKIKLTSLIKNGNVVVDTSRKLKSYSFIKDDILKKGEWKISFKYSHESLTEIYLYYLPSLNYLSDNENISLTDIKDAMQKKYGTCSAVDSTSKSEYSTYKYYWVKNNLKVHLNGTQPKNNRPAEMLIVVFSDTRFDKITISDE